MLAVKSHEWVPALIHGFNGRFNGRFNGGFTFAKPWRCRKEAVVQLKGTNLGTSKAADLCSPWSPV
jgi:hypothetical protein